MKRFFRKTGLILILVGLWISTNAQGLPVYGKDTKDQPIIVLAIDKIESTEFLECKLPAIRDFLQNSACGVMSIRSGSGYNNTESGFLTFGTGSRSVAPLIQGGAYKTGEILSLGQAGSIWKIATGRKLNNRNLVVPEIDWVLNQSEIEDLTIQPGLLGGIFRSNKWATSLISDQDTLVMSSRPGGYTIMDWNGIVDNGLVGGEINADDPKFPFRYHFDPEKVISGIKKQIKPKNLILVEFGDFARLDEFREEILPDHYGRLKQEAWQRLELFLKKFQENWKSDQCRFIIVAPSLSNEGIGKRSMLAPIAIRSLGYPKGLLTSGTTNWDGLVANIDLLPTLANMAGLEPQGAFSGRPIRSLPLSNPLEKIAKLTYKINLMNTTQRSLLDWYLWIISTGWIAVMLSILLKKRLGSGFLLIIVAIIPFTMLILPVLPVLGWQEGGMFLIAAILTILLMKLKNTEHRYLVLSAALWVGLIVDQLTGWNLIRFSALGYSAVAGSRYYGMGNEYMGVFLAVTLLLAHLIKGFIKPKWPVLLILIFSVFVLGWPQLGVNFGGTLAALVGFSFFAVKIYHLNWNNRKLWIGFCGIVLMVIMIGWWDSLRKPDLQTHLGRFFQLLIDQNLAETWQIFYRKAAMNLKLLVFSSWSRIILLALGINIIIKLSAKKDMILADESLVWSAVLISGFAAFFINDSGVVAFGTCLAFGFSYFLSKFEEREFNQASYTS